MRYNQDGNSSSLTIEAPTHHQQSPHINLFNPPVLSTNTPYSPEGSSFYHPPHHIFTALDVRSRLGSSSTSSTGMAHRTTTIPHHPQQISTRDQYSTATPSYGRRPTELPPRSPSFGSGPRRHPLSPTPSPIAGFTTPAAMDGSFAAKGQPTMPPLDPIVTLGLLQYLDGGQGTPVRPEINGTIDKGFFLADGEWTCYRRNYFSCMCSYTLSPNYQGMALQFTPPSSQQTYAVHGFAMSISAVVADNDGHNIELVQHTPKRDKGPIARPDKVRLAPKIPHASHHPLALYHNHADPGLPGRPMYDQGGFGPGPGSAQGGGTFQTEHTFERIQFKQATANNGKRRAAQQYYHLVVELWADLGPQASEPFIRVAYRRSAKMIVRGRSPGHYQSERRGSTSSGPGGGGSMGGYGNGPMMGGEFSPGGPMLGGGGGGFPGAGGGGYDGRGPAMPPYGGRHQHHEIPSEALIPAEEAKVIDATKGYQYYPGTTYEAQPDPRAGVEMFTHQNHRGISGEQLDHGSLESKAKSEYDGAHSPLPSLFHPGPLVVNRNCGRFEGKQRSEGYYPSMIPQSGVNIT